MATTSTENQRNSSLPTMKKFSFSNILHYLYFLRNYLSVEIFIILLIIPVFIMDTPKANLALEKACRVNLKLSNDTCTNMMDKSINNIDCAKLQEDINKINQTILTISLLNSTELNEIINSNNNYNIITDGDNNNTINNNNDVKILNITKLEIDVCLAESNSQALETKIRLYTDPIELIFGLIVIIFAGGWSDKKGLRKPCMILPVVAELSSYFVLLVAAIYMNELPMEFSSVISVVLSSMGGGISLEFLCIYSYLSEVTKEENRSFRFGVFAIVVTLTAIAVNSFSGDLFVYLGYIKLLMLCMFFLICSLLYVIFFHNEVRKHDINTENTSANVENSTDNIEYNKSFDRIQIGIISTDDDIQKPVNNMIISEDKNVSEKKNCCIENFNPILIVECARVLVRKRKNNGRIIIYILLIMYGITLLPPLGEGANEYDFARSKLGWDAVDRNRYTTYATAITLTGTAILVGGVKKIFKLSDSITGFVSAFGSTISRIAFVTATNTLMMYIGKTLDMFNQVGVLTLKSMLSLSVEQNELGRIFSIVAIVETLSNYLGKAAYSITYLYTKDSNTSAIFINSIFIFSIVSILFIVMYFMFKKKERIEAAEKLNDENNQREFNNRTDAETLNI